MRFEGILSLLFLTVAVVSCDTEPEVSLDTELTEAIKSAGGSLQAFMLPDSEDFSQIPQDPKNPLTAEKVKLGQLLFHETGLATNPKYPNNQLSYSCASCHHAGAGFQAGRVQGIAEGGVGFGEAGEGRDRNPDNDSDSLDVQPIRSPSILNAAYQEVMLWNGQFGATGPNQNTQGQWTAGTPKEVNHLGYHGIETQAIAGLTVHRMGIDMTLINDTKYRQLFDAAFPDHAPGERITKETMGLAIAAFERTVLANKAPFQEWLRGSTTALTDRQKQGGLLFFGKAGCVSCHTGPSLANMEFYALGMHDLRETGTYGDGVDEATRYGRGGFTGNATDNYKFKVPQLYSLTHSPFYGHGSSFETVEAVLRYKNMGQPQHPEANEMTLAEGFQPLGLSTDELSLLLDFVEKGLNDAQLDRYTPNSIPSGLCFPNNDSQSRQDLGCD